MHCVLSKVPTVQNIFFRKSPNTACIKILFDVIFWLTIFRVCNLLCCSAYFSLFWAPPVHWWQDRLRRRAPSAPQYSGWSTMTHSMNRRTSIVSVFSFAEQKRYIRDRIISSSATLFFVPDFSLSPMIQLMAVTVSHAALGYSCSSLIILIYS